MRAYSALITAMDHNAGRIVDHLEKMGVRDDTVIVFTADQGHNCGDHGLWGKGNATIPFNMYEESIRVPLIESHRGRIRGGQQFTQMISSYDFMPTLLDYVGVRAPEDRRAGDSYAPLLRGESQADRANCISSTHTCARSGPGAGSTSSVRKTGHQNCSTWRRTPARRRTFWKQPKARRSRPTCERSCRHSSNEKERRPSSSGAPRQTRCCHATHGTDHLVLSTTELRSATVGLNPRVCRRLRPPYRGPHSLRERTGDG